MEKKDLKKELIKEIEDIEEPDKLLLVKNYVEKVKNKNEEEYITGFVTDVDIEEEKEDILKITLQDKIRKMQISWPIDESQAKCLYEILEHFIYHNQKDVAYV